MPMPYHILVNSYVKHNLNLQCRGKYSSYPLLITICNISVIINICLMPHLSVMDNTKLVCWPLTGGMLRFLQRVPIRPGGIH